MARSGGLEEFVFFLANNQVDKWLDRWEFGISAVMGLRIQSPGKLGLESMLSRSNTASA